MTKRYNHIKEYSRWESEQHNGEEGDAGGREGAVSAGYEEDAGVTLIGRSATRGSLREARSPRIYDAQKQNSTRETLRRSGSGRRRRRKGRPFGEVHGAVTTVHSTRSVLLRVRAKSENKSDQTLLLACSGVAGFLLGWRVSGVGQANSQPSQIHFLPATEI
jgi:hypothetical protein